MRKKINVAERKSKNQQWILQILVTLGHPCSPFSPKNCVRERLRSIVKDIMLKKLGSDHKIHFSGEGEGQQNPKKPQNFYPSTMYIFKHLSTLYPVLFFKCILQIPLTKPKKWGGIFRGKGHPAKNWVMGPNIANSDAVTVRRHLKGKKCWWKICPSKILPLWVRA